MSNSNSDACLREQHSNQMPPCEKGFIVQDQGESYNCTVTVIRINECWIFPDSLLSKHIYQRCIIYLKTLGGFWLFATLVLNTGLQLNIVINVL